MTMQGEKSMMESYLRERNLPDFLDGEKAENWTQRRVEILSMLSEHVYGITPAFHTEVYSFTEARDQEALGGMAIQEWVRLSFQTPKGMYSFPFQLLIPQKQGPHPAFVHLSFPQKEEYPIGLTALREPMPVEEILDAGYAVANIFYDSVTSDWQIRDGLARAYPDEKPNSWGRIGMWAFAASRVLDYLLTRKEIDSTRVAVGGWSRLGKAALWCGAQDQRFSAVFSTESGCSGAALQRGKTGEQIKDITDRFAYWFCPNYKSFAGRETEMPFDQHFLLACIAPRPVFIGSAKEDGWADPFSEFLGAAAASKAYKLLGRKGLVMPKAESEAAKCLQAVRGGRHIEDEDQEVILPDGEIGYFMRQGRHGMSRRDWMAHLHFRKIHNI